MAKNNLLKEFRAFIERGSAIDMAVGIIVGGVMTGVVNSLVKDVIMPPIGLLIGGVDFSQLFFVLAGGEAGTKYATVEAAQAAGATTINIGLFLNTVVSFLITMFAVFMIVRAVNKARAKKPVTTHACPYCQSTISNAATKCPFCCSAVKPIETATAEESDLAKSIKNLGKVAGNGLKRIKKVAKIKK